MIRMRLRQMTTICLLGVSACASSPSAMVTTGERYGSVSEGIEEYKLGPGDKVRVTVFNETGLSGDFSVSADGRLSLPLIGEVVANGKSGNEVANVVQTALGNGYLRDPKVSVEIIEYRPFFVLGEVKQPGQFPYATSMTALNAIALAQGFSPRAQKSVVYIRRAGSNQEEAYRLTPDLRVLPGDTIRVGERYF